MSKAIAAGLGLETDIRNYQGTLVIAHDLPTPSDPLFQLVWEQISRTNPVGKQLFALNVKEDGLLQGLLHLHEKGAPAPDGAFFFDMSVPQLVAYAQADLPVALRVSEYEPLASLTALRSIRSRYLWIDGFHLDWFVGDPEIESLCGSRCGIVVSPEIHGRDPHPVWDWVYEARGRGADLGICTDRPLDFIAWAK